MSTEQQQTIEPKDGGPAAPADGGGLVPVPGKAAEEEPAPHPLKEIVQPFIDLIHAPRVLWGVNLPYFLEGFSYFGMLSLLALFFNWYVGLNDLHADWMVSLLTGGITFSMLFFGGLSDKWGVRKSLLVAFVLMLIGRVMFAAAPYVLPIILNHKNLVSPWADELHLASPGSPGAFSKIFLLCTAGILFVVLGYGLYQPAAYAAIRKYTDQKTAAMGYAMLYALMNFGGFLPGLISPSVRGFAGISGVFWMYAVCTTISIAITLVLLTRRTEQEAIAKLEAEKKAQPAAPAPKDKHEEGRGSGQMKANGLVISFAVSGAGVGVAAAWLLAPYAKVAQLSAGWIACLAGGCVVGLVSFAVMALLLQKFDHPLADPKFTFFIFALIPVQTLFAHNWLTLPQYVFRALGKVGEERMELFVNLNSILIFILTPTVAALTRKSNVYRMMILGTLVMAAPTFLLAIKPSVVLLLIYLVVTSVGEAMWQPRFLQYAAEIAPEGRTGAYMGVAQFPWFLTKVLTGLYAGWFLMKFCPESGPKHTEMMWLIYGIIAMSSSLILVIAKGWLGKDFKTKAA